MGHGACISGDVARAADGLRGTTVQQARGVGGVRGVALQAAAACSGIECSRVSGQITVAGGAEIGAWAKERVPVSAGVGLVASLACVGINGGVAMLCAGNVGVAASRQASFAKCDGAAGFDARVVGRLQRCKNDLRVWIAWCGGSRPYESDAKGQQDRCGGDPERFALSCPSRLLPETAHDRTG